MNVETPRCKEEREVRKVCEGRKVESSIPEAGQWRGWEPCRVVEHAFEASEFGSQGSWRVAVDCEDDLVVDQARVRAAHSTHVFLGLLCAENGEQGLSIAIAIFRERLHDVGERRRRSGLCGWKWKGSEMSPVVHDCTWRCG